MAATRRASRLRMMAARAACLCLALLFTAIAALGQSNPVPFVNQPLVPSAVAPGGPSFTLTVNGTGFVSGATVNWNGSPLATTFVSGSKLTATVPAANIVLIGTATVTVANPQPVGLPSVSNSVFLPVTIGTISVTASESDISLGGDTSGPLAVGDFNGDGKLDLAVGLYNNSLAVLLGDGVGDFNPSPSSPIAGLPTWPLAAASGDFNGDGKLDLAVSSCNSSPSANGCASSDNGSVTILLGDGDGNFLISGIYKTGAQESAGSYPYSLAVGDFNGDGKVDVVAVSTFSSDMSVMLGDGTGKFTPTYTQLPYNLGCEYPRSVAVGDFNQDGKLDLALACQNTSQSPLILLGDGKGNFTGGPAAPAVGYSQFGIAAADFNGDGKQDLAVVDSNGYVTILLGDGSGHFTTGQKLTTGASPTSAVVGDFNGDGKLDLAVSNAGDGTVSVFLGDGAGNFTPSPSPLATGTHSPTVLATGDFNGDGKLDFVTAGYEPDAASVLLQPSFVQLSPPSVSFVTQTLGTTPETNTVTLTNNLSTSLTISGIALTGTDAADFAQTNDCPLSPFTLAAAGSCTVTLSFAPSTTGSKTAALSVRDDGPGSPQQTVKLTGTAINPAATISPLGLSFGNQNLETISPAQTVTLTNTGTDPLTIASIAPTGDYAQTGNCPVSPSTLPVGGTCTISVTFTPTAGGTRAGWLLITDNAANSPQTVALTGTGTLATITLSTTSLTFASQPVSTTSAPQPAIATNSGTGPLVMNSVAITGDFAQTNNCPVAPATIAAGASCTISVTFTPATGGTRPGTLAVTDNASGSPQTVSLVGTGASPTATATPATLTFSGTAVGATASAQAVTLTNGTSGPLTISGIAVSGANASDFPQTNNCPTSPATLAATGTCTLNVAFKPSINGAESATLTISNNAASNPQTVSLNGTGQAPVASLSASSLDFPGQTVGTTSSPGTITLTDSGALPLTISNVSITSPFVIQSSNCPVLSSSLAAGDTCTISITFTPGFAGTTFGSLIASDNSLGSPTQTVSLTGEAPVSFPPQLAGTTSPPQAVTVANGSPTKSVTVTSVATTGDFVVASNLCTTLPPGGSCAPTVAFKPTGGGTRNGSLVIAEGGTAVNVPLSGTGQDFAVTTTGQSSATVNAGGTATFTLSIAPQGGFNQTVNLSCTLPAMMTLATCNVSPMSVNPSGANPANATVTITTTAGSEVGPRGPGGDETSPLQGLPRVQNLRNLRHLWMILVAFTLIALALPARRRRHFALAMTLLLILAWAACGGGAGVTHMPGTPAGIYTITITAADPQANLTQTTNFKLTVNP